MILRKGMAIVHVKQDSIEIFGENTSQKKIYNLEMLEWGEKDVKQYIRTLKILGFKEVVIDERFNKKILEEAIELYFEGISIKKALKIAKNKNGQAVKK